MGTRDCIASKCAFLNLAIGQDWVWLSSSAHWIQNARRREDLSSARSQHTDSVATDGPTTPFVINRYRRPDQNLREKFLKILKRAGVQPWPRLFQNLRASRETELLARYPAKNVSAWLGNSVPVAMRHYAMATEESFVATADPEAETVDRKVTPKSGSIPGISGAIGGTTDGTNGAHLPDESRFYVVKDSTGGYWLMGVEGLEPPTSSV